MRKLMLLTSLLASCAAEGEYDDFDTPADSPTGTLFCAPAIESSLAGTFSLQAPLDNQFVQLAVTLPTPGTYALDIRLPFDLSGGPSSAANREMRRDYYGLLPGFVTSSATMLQLAADCSELNISGELLDVDFGFGLGKTESKEDAEVYRVIFAVDELLDYPINGSFCLGGFASVDGTSVFEFLQEKGSCGS